MQVIKTIKITEEMVNTFAELTGDKNPIHLNEDYAKTTKFGKRIVHGMLVSSFISKIIAMDYPGNGSIYVKQDLNFLHPCFIGDELKYVITDIAVDGVKYTLSTKVYKDDLCILDGSCFVIKK
jgi:3-hydroxybutyryl-CoA dehydratase